LLFGGLGSGFETAAYAVCVSQQLTSQARKLSPIELPETGGIDDRVRIALTRVERQKEIDRLKAEMEAIKQLTQKEPKQTEK